MSLQEESAAFVKKWEKKRETQPAAEDVFIHLVEEIGELASEYVHKRERKKEYSEAKVENALGDILLQLFRIADLHGIDLERAVRKIIKEEFPSLS